MCHRCWPQASIQVSTPRPALCGEGLSTCDPPSLTALLNSPGHWQMQQCPTLGPRRHLPPLSASPWASPWTLGRAWPLHPAGRKYWEINVLRSSLQPTMDGSWWISHSSEPLGCMRRRALPPLPRGARSAAHSGNLLVKSPVSASVSSLFRVLISDQCLLGSPPSKLVALKSLTLDLLLGTVPRQVPVTPPLCRAAATGRGGVAEP